jgi:hypothetical protein
MNSNKSLRIILSGVLLVLAAATLRWWMSKPDDSARTTTIVEPESPRIATSQRSAVRLQPAARSVSTRAASARTPTQPFSPTQQRLFVEWKGIWYAAEILASTADSHYIRYSGYGPEWDEWVTPERMRYSDPLSAPPQNPSTPTDSSPAQAVRMMPEPGDPVVLWGNQWWRAEVLQTEGDKSLIRYVGYGAEWDEWVAADRFKVYSEDDARNRTTTAALTYPFRLTETASVPEPDVSFSPLVQGRPAQGDLLVEWGKKWWPAEILKQEGTSYFIHYKDYGTNWDEWVALDRLGTYSGVE